MTKRSWADPEPQWLPLRQAAFGFYIDEDGSCTRADEASFHRLANLLKSESGAVAAEIDPIGATFSFSFKEGSAGAAYCEPPWAILDEEVEGGLSRLAEKWPTLWHVADIFSLTADALSGLYGVVPILHHEEAARARKRCQAVRQATALVWRQFIIRAFGRAVSTKAVLLYARAPTLFSDFEQLPADIWGVLDVCDWENGVARAPDGTTYWSIFARPCEFEAASASKADARPSEVEVVSRKGATVDAGIRSTPRRTRGPKSGKLERTKQAMRNDIRAGPLTLGELEKMLEKELEAAYGVSRDTARKARNAVLSELTEASNSDK